LVEAIHGQATMAGVGAPWPAMGELAGEGREGEGEGERGAVGELGAWLLLAVSLFLCMRKKTGRRREGREKI
jgi:hypothetical protein